ncbi:hypothetical protein [Pedobacter agri]|uniref:hypothetical protein n=1 Tax=Pedobacter agri TaxID=454586 RepID=UPI002930A13F|nr:hypothetical protein [Pedobacter agri]
MPEDQAVNGDRWNGQFNKLLEAFNWTSLGDANMDLVNEIDEKHGVDRLFTFENFFQSAREEALIFEAKNYLTTSFSAPLIEEWVKVLDNKITKLKNSEPLREMFPILGTLPFRTGLIAIWFSDVDKYPAYRPKFLEALTKVKLTRQQGESNHIYVLENDAILRLACVAMAVAEINRDANTKQGFRFFYPADKRQPVSRSKTLSVNYFPAKFILGEYTDINDVDQRVVFYMGKLDIQSFERLRDALFHVGYLDSEKPLTIYTHQRDDSFYRKVEPEIDKIFKGQKVEFEELENTNQLPTFMRKK